MPTTFQSPPPSLTDQIHEINIKKLFRKNLSTHLATGVMRLMSTIHIDGWGQTALIYPQRRHVGQQRNYMRSHSSASFCFLIVYETNYTSSWYV